MGAYRPAARQSEGPRARVVADSGVPVLRRSALPVLSIASTAGSLAAIHELPVGAPPSRGPRAALVCHPHPLHGGTKENKVVVALARACTEAGLHALRFDFRGAGGSEGVHDGGRGERDDARAALSALVALGGGPVLVAGFSFGAWVGLAVGLEDPRVSALLAVAPPVDHYDFAFLGGARAPLTVIYAPDDELVPAVATERWLAGLSPRPEVHALGGGGHLFHGRIGALRQVLTGSLARLAAPG